MNREDKLNWWLRLAAAAALFRVVSTLVGLFFSLVVYVIPRGLFWRSYAFEPIIIPVLGTSVVVWFLVVKSEILLARAVKTKLILAVLLSVVAFCPVYLKRTVRPVMVSPLETAIQDGYSDESIQTIINKEYPGTIDGYNFRDYPGYPTPLSSALYAGRTNVVRMLLQKSASPEKALAYLEVFDEPKYEALIKTIQEELGTTTKSSLSSEAAPSAAPDER